MEGHLAADDAMEEIERLLHVQHAWTLECFGTSGGFVSDNGITLTGDWSGQLTVAYGRHCLQNGDLFVVRCEQDARPGCDWRIGVAAGIAGPKYFVKATGEASDDPLRGQRTVSCFQRPLAAHDLVSVRLVPVRSTSISVHFGLNGKWNDHPTFHDLSPDVTKFLYLAVDSGASLTVTLTPWHLLAK